jgi:hypothetical protein
VVGRVRKRATSSGRSRLFFSFVRSPELHERHLFSLNRTSPDPHPVPVPVLEPQLADLENQIERSSSPQGGEGDELIRGGQGSEKNYTSGTFSLSTVHLPTRIPCQFRSEQPALPAPRLLHDDESRKSFFADTFRNPSPCSASQSGYYSHSPPADEVEELNLVLEHYAVSWANVTPPPPEENESSSQIGFNSGDRTNEKKRDQRRRRRESKVVFCRHFQESVPLLRKPIWLLLSFHHRRRRMRVVARLACGAGGRIPESVCKKRLSTLG